MTGDVPYLPQVHAIVDTTQGTKAMLDAIAKQNAANDAMIAAQAVQNGSTSQPK